MRPPKRVANPCLAALVRHAGFTSVERFAEAVNVRAWQDRGVKLSYDHVSVKRWIGGAACQYPEVVAAVLSDAWGIPIPVGAVWPELRNGEGPVPVHLQPWVAARTLEDLAVFIGGDMLTRRETLAQAVALVAGSSLVDPLTRWLDVEPGRLEPAAGSSRRIGTTDVVLIEQATEQLRCADSAVGGGVMREATIGQLKYAADLARHGRYADAVGDRLLAAVAQLATEAGWMSHDLGLEGPAQRYFLYGLQASAQSRDEIALRRMIGVLTCMARQMGTTGHPDTGLRLLDLALGRLPGDRSHFNSRRATLWSLKARMHAGMGASHLPEMRSAVDLSFEFSARARAVADDVPWPESPAGHNTEAELAGVAAEAFGMVAREDPRLAPEAEKHALRAVEIRGQALTRSRVFDRIELARARFLGGEPDQAAQDAITAADLAATVTASVRVRARLRSLVTDAEPYQGRPPVQQMRERLLAA